MAPVRRQRAGRPSRPSASGQHRLRRGQPVCCIRQRRRPRGAIARLQPRDTDIARHSDAFVADVGTDAIHFTRADRADQSHHRSSDGSLLARRDALPAACRHAAVSFRRFARADSRPPRQDADRATPHRRWRTGASLGHRHASPGENGRRSLPERQRRARRSRHVRADVADVWNDCRLRPRAARRLGAVSDSATVVWTRSRTDRTRGRVRQCVRRSSGAASRIGLFGDRQDIAHQRALSADRQAARLFPRRQVRSGHAQLAVWCADSGVPRLRLAGARRE